MAYQVLLGDCLESLRGLRSESVHCCVTSPPYWGLRDYGKPGQLGMEKTPEEYVAKMVEVFREVRRVLRFDGTLWLNLGDSYATGGGAVGRCPGGGEQGERFLWAGMINTQPNRMPIAGLKPKDLVGVPWRVAFALQADGWWLRQDIIWNKPNPMPESVTDRCTKAHEYVFLLAKSGRYYFDKFAIEEEAKWDRWGDQTEKKKHTGTACHLGSKGLHELPVRNKKNRRSVWKVSTKPYKGAHFATMPPDLVEPCILAGTSEAGCCEGCGAPLYRQTNRTKLRRPRPNALTKRTGEAGTGNHCANDVAGVKVETTGWLPPCDCGDGVKPCVVLDPFAGSGTTLGVAEANGRDSIGLELNEDYVGLIAGRVAAIVAAKPRPKTRKLPLFQGLSDE